MSDNEAGLAGFIAAAIFAFALICKFLDFIVAMAHPDSQASDKPRGLVEPEDWP